MSSSSLEESNTKKPQVIVGNYIIQDKIGQGSFATVYKAQHKVIHILCKELPFLINLFFFLFIRKQNKLSLSNQSKGLN